MYIYYIVSMFLTRAACIILCHVQVTKQEEKLVQKEDELKQVKEKLEMELRTGQEYQRKFDMVSVLCLVVMRSD